MKTWAEGRTIRTLQAGALNILLLPFILMLVFFFAAAGFTYWAYNGRLAAKAVSDTAAKNAIDASKDQISAAREKEFAAKQADPFNTYESPAAVGSIIVKYPKNWSAYVQEQVGGNAPVNGYFYPGFVPAIQDGNNKFATRLQVVGQSLDNALQIYQSYVQAGQAKQQTYRSPNIPNVIGYRLDGKIDSNKFGIMILLPVRDKTVKIWTENPQYTPDFLNIIVPNFTFTP